MPANLRLPKKALVELPFPRHRFRMVPPRRTVKPLAKKLTAQQRDRRKELQAEISRRTRRRNLARVRVQTLMSVMAQDLDVDAFLEELATQLEHREFYLYWDRHRV
jgi:hypothetical protein